MKRFFSNVFYSGLRDQLNSEARIKLLFINSIIFLGLIVLIVFGFLDLADNNLVLGGITLTLAGLIVALYFAIRISRRVAVGVWVVPVLMFVFFTYLTASGDAHSTTVLWMLTYPSMVAFLLGPLLGASVSLVFLAVQIALLFVPDLSPVAAIDPEFKLRLVGVYTIVLSFSLAFETIRLRSQQALTRAAEQLAAAKVQTDGILASVSEGIFLLDHEFRFDDQHSRSLLELLDSQAPGGRLFLDCLTSRIGQRDVAATADYLQMFFAPNPPWQLLEEINPLEEITFATPEGRTKHLSFHFRPVELATGRRILGTVRDVTEERELGQKLKEEGDRSDRQMKHLFQILHVKPELLLQFLQDADEEIAAINSLLKDPKASPEQLVESLFHGVHSVKGNAALVGLTSFAQRVHDLETHVAAFRTKAPEWQDFLDMTVRLSGIQAELTEIRGLIERMGTFQKGLEASAAQNDLLVLSLEKALERLQNEMSLPVDLDAAELETATIPEQHRKIVKDVILQFVRNTFAHGLEPAAERRARGKPARGRIRLAGKPQEKAWTFSYWDDGRGLDPQGLRSAALRAGLVSDPSQLNDQEALQLIFRSGFSTARQTDLHAGRGVGMSLVKDRIIAAGGKVNVRSVQGRGVAFDITLPMP